MAVDSVTEDAPIVDPAPSAPRPAAPALPWPLEWNERIEAARRVAKSEVEKGRKRVRKYRQKPNDRRQTSLGSDQVRVPAEFYFTEQKRAQMFYRVPEITLTGVDPVGKASASLFQNVVNYYLGPYKANVKVAIDEVMFDLLCPLGYGGVEIAYRSVTKPTPDLMAPNGMAQVPVWESFDIDRIPPGRLLIPTDFIGSDFDKADWLGYEFYEPCEKDTPGAAKGGKDWEESLLSRPLDDSGQTYRRKCVKVYYRAALIDKNVLDPDHLRMFVLKAGESKPSKHEDVPQIPGPDGKPIRMPGFPISIVTIRYVSDTCRPPSDCAITENIVDEQSRGRTQLLTARDRNMPQFGYDATMVDADTIQKLVRGEHMGGVPFKGGSGPNSTWEIRKGNVAPENFQFDTVARNDLDRAWAMGAPQTGVNNTDPSTATENQIVQQNSDTRLDYERDKLVQWFLQKVVAKFARLIQMFADAPDYVAVLGPDGTAELQKWTRQSVQGNFNYDIKINSQLRPDSNSELRRVTAWVNYSAQSPYVDQLENWRQAAKAFGYDPTKLVRQPPPPPKPEPEPMKMSLALKGDDLNPLMPQYANVITAMRLGGMEDLANAMLPPPQNLLTTETAPTAPVLSKHGADASGQLPGEGSMVAEATGSAPRGDVTVN